VLGLCGFLCVFFYNHSILDKCSHPELVSASIVQSLADSREVKWTLNQIQGDGGARLLGFYKSLDNKNQIG
jgi:hypothetical protein